MEKQVKPKKPIWKRWWFILIVGLIILSAIASSGDKEPLQANNPPAQSSQSGGTSQPPAQTSTTPPAQTSTPQQTTPPAQTTPKTAPAKLTLSSGHYTAGIDFPAGKYTIEAVKGGGNVSSSNAYSGGINAIMGVAGQGDMYQQKYSNINLPKGTVLSISRVTVTITSDAASTDALQPRNQSIKESVTLGNGHFVAGKDFPAGIYDISVVSGGGNVSSSNLYSGGINAIMGTAGSNDMYEQLHKNISLTKDVTLSISNVTVKLTPSK